MTLISVFGNSTVLKETSLLSWVDGMKLGQQAVSQVTIERLVEEWN